MRRYIITILAIAALAYTATAQDIGGTVLSPSAMTAMDMANMSRSSAGLGSARSAAMAGAFVSLGGDVSSMSQNPAGLGMYRNNEITLTPSMSFSRSTNSAAAWEKNSANKFALGNIGIVLKLRESSKGVTAINLGFGYTRTADFNYSISYMASRGFGSSSIADVYAKQLAANGISSNQLKNNYDEYNDFRWGVIDPSNWGAVLAYQGGLVGDGTGSWKRDMISNDAAVQEFSTIRSSGSSGEYNISLGLNINSKIYVGASIGIPILSISRDIYYGEQYTYETKPALDYRMTHFNYDQQTRIKGTGFNFKLGVIYSPIKNLRLGFAIHTPTFYSMTYKYRAGLTSEVFAENNVDGYELNSKGFIDPPLSSLTSTLVDDGGYSWKYVTPTRMMFGASYIFAKRVAVSVDYERDWYNGIRVKNSPYGKHLYDNYFRESFKGSNELRVGVECRVIPQVALRMGYGLWSGALRDSNAILSSPVTHRIDTMSVGAGIALAKWFSIDVAYQFCKEHLTPYMAYYYTDATNDIAANIIDSKIGRHTVLMTLGFRF